MISIVISTYRPEYLKALRLNIDETIGVNYEVIAIENKGGLLSLCEAYNLGAAKAKFPFICFLHEDVKVLSNNWGSNVIEIFDQNPELGLAGLSGSKLKLPFVSGWTAFSGKLDRDHIFYILPDGSVHNNTHNPEGGRFIEVDVLDGVFLFTRKAIWEEVRFNVDVKGFHFYDIDYSLRVRMTGRKLVVLMELDVLHFSYGNFDNKWLKAAVDYHERNIDLIRYLYNKSPFKIKIPFAKAKWLKKLSSEDIDFKHKFLLVRSYGFHLHFKYLYYIMYFLLSSGQK